MCPRGGTGTYAPPAGNPVVSATTISSTVHNNTVDDLGDEITNSIARDGQSPPTANLPMGGFKHTGVAVASAVDDYLRASQGQNSTLEYAATVGGTANAITLTLSPVPAAYVAGQTFRFIAGSANTAATTVNVNSLGVKDITKNGSTALVASDIPSGALVQIQYDGTRFQLEGALPNTIAGARTFSGLVTFSAGADMTAATTPATTAVGFLGAPQNAKDQAYTFVMADAGKHIFHNEVTARTYTIPANASVAYPIGTIITIVNGASAGSITLAITTDTLQRGDGVAGTGSRTIPASSVASIVKVTATIWFISGAFS